MTVTNLRFERAQVRRNPLVFKKPVLFDTPSGQKEIEAILSIEKDEKEKRRLVIKLLQTRLKLDVPAQKDGEIRSDFGIEICTLSELAKALTDYLLEHGGKDPEFDYLCQLFKMGERKAWHLVNSESDSLILSTLVELEIPAGTLPQASKIWVIDPPIVRATQEVAKYMLLANEDAHVLAWMEKPEGLSFDEEAARFRHSLIAERYPTYGLFGGGYLEAGQTLKLHDRSFNYGFPPLELVVDAAAALIKTASIPITQVELEGIGKFTFKYE